MLNEQPKGETSLRKQLIIALALAVFGCGLWAKPIHAQAPAKIAIINIQQAIAESEEGKKESAILNTKANAKKNELDKLQKDIESMQKQLQDQATTLNDDAKAQLAAQIERKGKELQRQQQDAQEEFQALSNEVVNRIGRKILVVIEKFANEQNYTAILDVSSSQSGVLWFTPSSNITTEIIRRYDTASSASKPTPATPPPAKPATPPAVKK
jgi:outer membrane protein